MKKLPAKPRRKYSSDIPLCPCTECLSEDLERSGLHIRCRKCGYSFDYDHSDFERAMIHASGQREFSEGMRAVKVAEDWNREF